MKQKYLLIIILILAYTYANCQIITFSGINSRNKAPVIIDSILIQNLSKGKDTLIKDTYFNLSGISGIGDVARNSIPFSIEQNYPNSFDDEIRFTVNIPKSGILSISLINYLGETITSFSNNTSEARHEFQLSGGNFPAGAYFLISSLNNEIKAIKIMKAGSSSISPAKIEYIGCNNFESMVFDAGDKYKFIGYAEGFLPRILSFIKPQGGENYVFDFLGNKPVIQNFTPNEGCIGTKVLIIGKYFVPDTNKTSVYFGNLKAQIISLKTDTIIARVPDGTKYNLIKVICPYDETNENLYFNVKNTDIYDFYPRKASPFDTITIYGAYFLPEKEILRVKIGDTLSEVISSTEIEIKAIVPNDAKTDLIKVQFFSVNVSSKDSLIIPDHRIYSFSPSKGLAGTKVSIRGKNFGFDKNKVKLLFGTIEAEILNIQDTIIETKVPNGLRDKFIYLNLVKDSSSIRSEKQFEVVLSRWNFAKAKITINLPNCVYYLITHWTNGNVGSKADTIYETHSLVFDAKNEYINNCPNDTDSHGDSIKFVNPYFDCGCSFCLSWKVELIIDTINNRFLNVHIFYIDGEIKGPDYVPYSWNKLQDFLLSEIPYQSDTNNILLGYINGNLLEKKLSSFKYIFNEVPFWMASQWIDVYGISILKFVPESYIKIELIPW